MKRIIFAFLVLTESIEEGGEISLGGILKDTLQKKKLLLKWR